MPKNRVRSRNEDQPEYKLRERYKSISRINTEDESTKIEYDN